MQMMNAHHLGSCLLVMVPSKVVSVPVTLISRRNLLHDAGNVMCRRRFLLVVDMNSDVKGHTTLIAAASESVNVHPEVQFLLVGDGPKRCHYEAMVEKSGRGENFLFLGRRNDVPQILASCDVAVLPSLAEGLPNAVLEYLASGLPVVATALGGNLEVIEDGVTGL